MKLTTEQMSRENPKTGETWVDQFGEAVFIEFPYARHATDEAQIGPAHVVFSYMRKVVPRDSSKAPFETKEVRFMLLPEFMGTIRVDGGYAFRYARQVEIK